MLFSECRVINNVEQPALGMVIRSAFFTVGTEVLGAFARLRKATVSFAVYFRLSVRMEQLGFHCTDFFCGVRYLSIFSKICGESFVKFRQEWRVR